MSFTPNAQVFAVTAAETAVVGDGISAENGSALKYTGVNSMVGTLISWNGNKGEYISHPVNRMSSVWVIDNKGEMVNGANNDRCPPINFYSKKNDNLSAIKLIAGNNATPNAGTSVNQTTLYTAETFNNITNGTFNGKSGVNYFTVGGKDATANQISSDWAKAIFAASLYSNSGILNNEDFGGAKASGEYPTDWVSEFQTKTGGNYVTQFGTPFNENLEENNKAGKYNYIAIKLESDWIATDVSKIKDVEKDENNEPIGAKGHIGRLSNGVADNNQSGDTLIPLGTTFDANYDKHIMSDIDTGNVYLNSVYTDGKVDTSEGKSTNAVLLSDRIKNYATTYNRQVRTQQLTFCPAGEGYSFGRLAIPDNAYVILDLNGHKIDRALDDNDANVDTIVQSVFILGQYARLEVFDSSVSEEHPYGTGEVTGGVTRNGTGMVFDNQIWDNYGSDSNYANSVKGGGFTLRNRAELTVHSGSVTNNQGYFGGAFYGVGASTVNVFDARVEGNSAIRGGMCYLSQGSFMTLNMFGGLVQGNSARMDGFAKTNSHGQARQPTVDTTETTTAYDKQGVETKTRNPDGFAHEGGGVCVYQESYCNIYGGTIAYNYSATFGGGISVSYNSFLKLFGGEITGNVAKGLERNINGAKIVSESNPKEDTETPKANVGGAGINMYQDSAGIYLNGPAKVMGNYCSQVKPEAYTTEKIAALIESDPAKQDSNLYLSLTVSMSRYTWESGQYVDNANKYGLVKGKNGELQWDEEYAPTLQKFNANNTAVTCKGQMKFNPSLHLYPEIKVQGSLYRDAQHVAQVSITPAAGIEAGGYIMRQFYPKGWEDSSDPAKQNTNNDGTDGARPLKSGEGGTIDESSHAKDQINSNGDTTFNLREFLKTGATSGYVDGFLFTDGGTSIVAGTGDDDGWYMALGTRQKGNLPVQWQYYDGRVDPKTNKPYGWLNATTSAETGTGFTLVYNGTDRRYDIRVFVDRTKLTSDTSGDTGRYFYLYYDYYTEADEAGNEKEIEDDGTAKKHYLYLNEQPDKVIENHTNILRITSGYKDDEEIVQEKGVIYASERYDILGYRFTIRPDIKFLVGPGDGFATPFNENDDFQANPNYATMKIDRATLMVSQIKLADIERYYDGTTDFYIPSSTISAGTLTGQAPKDQENLLMKFSGESNGYVHGKLSSPNVGTNNVALEVIIEELGGENHEAHDKNTFPDKCLLANYNLYDLNTETMYPAEDREEMSVTLNVNVKPKPITVTLEKQTYEYGSIPVFGEEWGTHTGTANWAETFGKAEGGESLKALFEPQEAPKLEDVDFDPNFLGKDGKLAQADIDTLGVVLDLGDKAKLSLYLNQILKIMFTSSYDIRSSVSTYGGSFSYTNGNYDVTWKFGETEVHGMVSGVLSPAQINGLIEITKRKIKATIPDQKSIYGEAQVALTLPDEKIAHVGDDGEGLVFGDTLNATLGLTDAKFVATASNILRATMSADGKSPIIGEGYYTIAITNLDKINSNYELIEGNVTRGHYTVYPRKIVLTANPYTSVYGDPVAAGMGGFAYTLAESQTNNLDVTSTVIFPTDLNAFNKGISYAYSEEGDHKNKGEYKFNVTFDHTKATESGEDIGINYDVTYGAAATHTIEARKVNVLIASPESQSSEYGEAPVAKQGTGTGTYWRPQYATNASTPTVVLGEDWEEFVKGIHLYLAEGVDKTAPAGQYPIMGRYDGSKNYEVDFSGMWEGNIDEKYKDPDYDVNQRAGKYTINRRNIVLNLSSELASEYGDDLVKFWEYETAYDFTRDGVGDALVNGDSLTFDDPSLFYIRVSGSNIYGGEGNEKFDEKNPLHANTYTVIFDLTKYKSSAAYKAGANANYEITVNNGMYTVDRRAIKIEVGAKVDDVFQKDATIQYGNPVPERMAQVTRTTAGKEGGGFIGEDGAKLNEFLATDNSISNYSSSLTPAPGKHLRVGLYNFTANQNYVSNDYNVTWEFGTLTVEAREVNVTIVGQTTTYTGVEPNVDNSQWEFVDGEGNSLVEGDSKSIVVLDKEDGANAGKYDITLSCTDNNYKFIVDSDSGKDAFVIKPAVIGFSLVGGDSVFDREMHRAEIIFTGSGLTPTMHGISEGTLKTNDDGSVTYTFTDNVYTVTFTYEGMLGKKIAEHSHNFTYVGTYTVKVTLVHSGTFGAEGYNGNYCFTFNEAGETAEYERSATYSITKAHVTVSGLDDVVFNRQVQLPMITFRNSANGTVLPVLGEEYGYWFEPTNTWQKINMAFAKGDFTGIPSHADIYTTHIVLLGDARGNFEIEGATGGNVEKTVSVITGYPKNADGTVNNDTLSEGNSSELKYEKQVLPEEELAEGMHYVTTFTVSQLDILLRHTSQSVVYDYDFSIEGSDEGQKSARQGRHTNDALAIVFTNLKGNAKVDDVPYRLFVYRMDTEGYYLDVDGNRYGGSGKGKAAAMEAGPFLVFHYTTGTETGNFVHFGPCTSECDSSAGEATSHHHIHFTYDAEGKVTYTADALTNHSADIQKLREAFTNAGKFELYVVLDNCSYKIQGGTTPLKAFKPDCYQDSCACEIMEQFSFEIAQATLTPYLFDSVHGSEANTDAYKLEGSALQIPYDGAQHYLWVWFTNNNANSALPQNRVPVSETGSLAYANYYAQYSYDGWSGRAETSATVSEASDGYKNVGEYTVHISLKETGNFRLSSGGHETTIVYNIVAQRLAVADENVTFEFTDGATLDRAQARIDGEFIYIAANWEPVVNVLYKGTALTLVAEDTGDYTLAYSNNLVASSDATVTITGAHNYSGTITLKFTISPKSLGTGTFNEEDPKSKNDSEITETQLTAAGFVYTGTQLNYTTSFGYDPKGVSDNRVSMTMGADYERTLYKQNGDGWTKVEQVVNAGTYRLVVTGKGNYKGTYVIEFTVDKATVSVVEPNNLTFNRAEQTPDITFENVDAGNSVVPTKSGRDEYSIAYSPVADTNAKLGSKGLPFNAGTYDVTVTLTSENFQFEGGETEKTVKFVIDKLGVYAVQMMTEAYYNGQSYFYGDIYGSNAEKRYGGEGPWTFNFSSLTTTDVSGIGYTITYNNGEHTVVVSLGGYEKGHPETLLADSFTLDGAPSDWEAIKGLGLFTNVNWQDGVQAYTFTVGFADGNYKLERGSEFGFTVLPSILTLDNIESKVYNAQEQIPDVKFSLINTSTLDKDQVNKELEGQFTLKYRVSGTSTAFGDSKPVAVNKYDVEVTVTNHNYAFDRSGKADSTQTFDITPLNISEVTDFEVTIPNRVYTGDAVTSEITQVVVTIGDKVITFKQGAKGDNEVELSEDWFRIIGYNNNTNAGEANVTISAGKNFTGSTQVLGAFEIVARNIVVKIEDKHTVYGQSLEISNVENVGWSLVDPNDYGKYSVDWNWKGDWEELASSPKHYIVYKNDSLGIDLVIQDGHYNTKGGSLLVGTYAIVNNEGVRLASVNENYKIKFVGSWKGEDADKDLAGTYTVTPREIVITPQDVTKQYGDITKANLADIISGFLWEASYTNSEYTGEAILEADRDLFGAGISLNIITADSDWSKGTTSNLNGGRYAIAVVYNKDATKSTYHGGEGGEFFIGDQYKITLGGSFAGEGSYGEDSAFDGTEYAAHAGTLELTSRSIVITINPVKHEYNGQEPTNLTWELKDGSNLAAGDEASILGVVLSKAPGVEVGTYSITGAYTESGSYIVVFEDGVNAVEITPRLVVVTISDQSHTYDSTVPEVGSVKGSNWTVKLSESSTYYKTGVEEAIVGDDVFGIVLSKTSGIDAGKYAITGVCDNSNYSVTWVGSWEEADENEGKAGVYTVKPRTVTVEIEEQSSVYGDPVNPSSLKDIAWKDISASKGQDGILDVETLTIHFALPTQALDKYNTRAADGVLIVGKYALTVTYSYNKNYDVTFVLEGGDTIEDLAKEGYSASVPDLYEVTQRKISVTVSMQEHIYDGTAGEPKADGQITVGAALNAQTTTALAAGDTQEDLLLSLTREGTTDPTNVNVGNYDLKGICGNPNYDVDWTGLESAFHIVGREITIEIQNQQATYNGKGTVHTAQNDNSYTYWKIVAGDLIEDDKDPSKFGVTLQIQNDGEWNVGTYAIYGTKTGTSAGNYTVIFKGDWSGAQYNLTAGVYTITAKEITVTIGDVSSTYGENEETLTWSITETDLADDDTRDDLGVSLTKATGGDAGTYPITGTASGKNYNVTFKGNWDKDADTDSDSANDGKAGVYTINQRKVTVTVYSQSGVYGGNQDKDNGINSTQYTAWDVKEGSVLARDNLEITVTIVFDPVRDISALGKQLNAGWYSIRVTYHNNNYKVTFACEHKILTDDGNVTQDDVNEHEIKGTFGGGVYTVENGYRVYPRRLEITVAGQEDDYKGTGVAPTVKQKSADFEAWTATNVLNGSMPPFVSGEEGEFKIELKVQPAKNSKWNAGAYNIIGEISEADKNNYVIDRIQNGTFTIKPLTVTVTVEAQSYAVYNGTDWAGDFNTKSLSVDAFSNSYWTAEGVLSADQELFAKAIQLNLLGEAINANVYSAGGDWRTDANEDIKTNYVVNYVGGNVFTVNKRQLNVAIENATSVYGEEQAELSTGAITCTNDTNEATRDKGTINGDDLGIALVKTGGTAVGEYPITGTWNNNGNYEVTFTGRWGGDGADDGHAGIYKITERKLTVHVNDQGGVFGGRTYTNLSTFQGDDENNGGWYIIGFTETTGISQHNQDNHYYLISGDNLLIVLTLNNDTSSEDYAGKCAISAVCNNPNYKVKFKGSWSENDKYKDIAGTFTVQKRKVTVTLRNQSATYDGKTHTASEFSARNSGWEERVTNDPDNNTVTFVTPVELDGGRKSAPAIAISLSMEGAKNVGNYAIHIVITRDEVVIFDSHTTPIGESVKLNADGSVVISTNEYEITVIGTKVRDTVSDSSDVKVCSNYKITPKAVTLTIDNKISTYGETLSELTWQDLARGIVSADFEAVEAAIKLAIEGREANLRGETYLVAGTYDIKATVASDETTKNYTFSFVGTTGTSDHGIYTVNKRNIGLRVNSASVTYGDDPVFEYTVVSLGGITGDVILACDKDAFGAVIKYEILREELSTSAHLKAGEYPVWMSLDSGNENFAIVNDNYDITFTGLWNGGGTYTDGRTALNSRAGVLTVGKKNITVTDITSASNKDRTSEYGDAVPNDWSYVAAADSVLAGDNVTVVYRTDATARANVGTYPVTVTLAASAEGNDNANYTMTMRETVNYVITKRIVTVDIPEAKTITYGDVRKYPDVVVTRPDGKGVWNEYYDGESILNVSISFTVVGETLSSSGFLRVKMESGAVIGYDITVSLSGDNANNYQIDGSRRFEKKLIVNKRPVTVTIDDKSSVYGESEQALTYSVDGLADGDTETLLGITLTRQGLSSGQSNVGIYAITGTSNCTDYEVTFKGNWDSDETYRDYQTKAGIYTITERAVRIEIYNQSAPYGEEITVGSVEGTNWNSMEGAVVDGVKYYSVKLGDSLGIRLVLKKLSEVSGHLTRGAYELTLDESSVNSNYKVTVVRGTLPDGDDAHAAFPEDFSKSETSIGDMMWGYRTPISLALQHATHGMFFVTIREVDVFINDQNGVYGENYTLHQYEGNNAYTISLTTDKGTTGSVFKDGLAVTFDLVTTAYEGAGDAGLKNGKLTYAGYYPIFSSGITATKDGEPLEDQSILQNYRFNFKGGWTHGGTYPSGSAYNERVGVFTVQKRNVTVTVSDVSTTYGTYRDLTATGGEFLLANQKGYTAIVNNGTGSAFVTEADEALFNIALTVKYSADQVSTGRALNAGSYDITPSKLEALEGDKAFNSYDVTFATTAPKLEVAKANITISILGGKSSVYGDTLREEQVIWNSKIHSEMFNATVSGGYVEGDVLDFDMYASLIDDVTAHRFAKAGNYAIYVPAWIFTLADNANYNTPTWTGSFTGGVRTEDAHYANVAGIYTVNRKPITVTINDAQSEYGETIDSSKFTYTLPKGWKVGDDSEDDLHIVLATDATASSPFSATGYAIKGYSSSDNYEVTFEGSYLDSTSGTLTVDPRRIVVVILPQDSVYGTNPVANSETTQWFVVRDGSMVNSVNQHTAWESVFGAAREKTMGELFIALTKGITYVDDSSWSNGNGLFVGDYAITGRCDNSNFDVVFRGYNDEYDGSVEKYYPTVSATTEKEKAEAWGKVDDEWGVYTITPLSVTVQIKDRSAIYGSTLTDGVTELRYNAKLVNTQSIAWTYGDGSGTFTVGHEQYLDFYLRCAAEKSERGDIYAEVGAHEIEGVWAENIAEGDTDLYGIKLNYDVKFVNEKGEDARGVFTVTPAAIQQNNREAVDGETFTGTLWNQTQLYRGENGGYSLKVDERFFIFAGDLKFGEDRLNGGSVIYDAATVTYNNLKRDNQSVIAGTVSEDKLEITTFGVWTVEVTIAKENHETVTFTLSLTVVQADLTVTLRPEARFTAIYGEYLADGQEAKGSAMTFEELKQDLKTWLFDTAVIEKIDGAENIASSLQAVINALLRVEGDDAITVSIITTDDNVSTGGYLNAGNYVLTFEVDGNIKIKFAQTYSVVTVQKRALEMKWTPAEGEKPDMEGNTFTYNYDGEDHKVVAMPTDLLEGDLVANFGMTRYLVREGTEEVQLEMRLVGEYRVRVLVDVNSASEGNHDIGNYEVQSIELTVFIKTVSITVLIKDRTNEYGETELDANAADTWEIIKGKETLPEGEDLLITLSFDTFSGSERRPSGKYKISGRSDNANYTVEFVGSYGETAAGRHDGDFGTYTVTKRKIVVNAHDIFATYGDYTSDALAGYNFVTLGDRAYSTSRPDGPVGYSTMAQTSTVTIFPDDTETLALSITLDPENAQYTSTGYLKANTAGYRLICSYKRDFNYEITFVLDSGAQYNGADSTSKLIVSKKDLSVTIYTRTAVYGEDRPTMPMNYSVSGFASEDTAWFETNRDTAESFLKFTVRNADTQEALDENKTYDPVGVYIIMLESNTSESHDIGSNYNITVTGEWTAYGKYTSDIYVGKASRYEVTPRSITIVLRSASGEYGDANVAERFTVEIISTLFAPDDTAESIRSMITLDTSDVFESGRTKAAGASYDVTAKMSSPNYTLDGTLTAKYQVVPRQIDLRALDLSSQYGDRHKDLVADSGYSIGWDAVRSNGMAGNGIAYPTDAIRDLIRVATDTANTAEVGAYRIYIDASTINADKNYHVNNIIDGTLTVERRKIKIRVNPQSSEYGEVHLLSDKYGEDWTAERAEPTKYSDESVVVLPSDIYDIVLRFAIALDRTSPAGSYEFAAQFNNRNYVVDEVEGVYTITPRKISVRIEDGTGEYGDPVSGLRWTASRVGGNAIVNGDELNITLNAVLPNGKPVDTTIGIGTYPIIVTAQNNPNYEITFTGDYEGALPDVRIGDAAGNYVMTPRRIIMTFNGESEYGDLVDPKGASYRADGKEGPAIVNGDDFGYEFEWVDDPYADENLSDGYPAVGSYRLQVRKPTAPTPEQANYEVVSDDVELSSVYRVVPRKVTVRVKDGGRTYGDAFVDPNLDIMGNLDITRTTPGKSGEPILHEDIKFFSLTVIDGDVAQLTDGIPYFVGTYNYDLTYTLDNGNYELQVVYGNYVVSPKPITVHIDDKTQNYGEDLLELTHSTIEGVLEGDDLGFALSVQWGEGQEGLTWHNAGVYRIEASAANPNYALVIDGTLDGAGAYTILKVHNSWLREYAVERLQQGDEPDPELLPEAEWGDVIIKYYLDEACTQELDRDIRDADRGTYYVKVTVLDTINWDGLESDYIIEIFNDFLNIDGTDITAYVCLFAAQFPIGLFALLFVGRKKKQKNK